MKSIVIPKYANTPSPGMSWKKQWLKRRDYFQLCHKSLTPPKEGQTNSKPDCIIQLICGGVRTYASFETTSNIGELRLSRTIKNASPFRWTMANYICSSSYFVENLQSKSLLYIYCLKLQVNGVKTCDINGKEALTGDWKGLNKETYVCNICLQNNAKVYLCTQL